MKGGPEDGGDGSARESGTTPAEGGDADRPTDGGTVTCKSGKYSGTFNCSNPDAGDGGGSVAAGSIALELTPADAGPSGVGTVAGSLDGSVVSALISSTVTSAVTGSVTCGGSAFSGALTGGNLAVGGNPSLDTFSGTIGSGYNGSAFVSGTLVFAFSASAATCSGTWSASYTGP